MHIERYGVARSSPVTSICYSGAYRVGAPRFLGTILVIWGLVAGLFAWMRTATHFYLLRFILGLAESGAYPGNAALLPCSETYACTQQGYEAEVQG